MRGVPSYVTSIRKKVFTEVARLAYEGGDYTRMEKLPYVIGPRRPGDIAACYADPTKAREELGWEAKYGIEEMCRDSWNWQSHNPNGYRG